MTHTLHRQLFQEDLQKDFVILSMAAQGFNNQGATPKLVQLLEILIKHNPDNYGDDSIGSIFTGITLEKMKEHAFDHSYMDAVYTNIDDLVDVLKELKEADLGISVTVTGDRETILRALKAVGIKPNSIHLSLGIMGRKERLPERDVLKICSLCGHGMIAPARVRDVARKIGSGKIGVRKGAELLGNTCTCGIFNTKVAAEILQKMVQQGGSR